jgi:hypothetical protein
MTTKPMGLKAQSGSGLGCPEQDGDVNQLFFRPKQKNVLLFSCSCSVDHLLEIGLHKKW